MPFVKLDCGILDSTLWVDREAREIFLTALLMAVPHEIEQPTPELFTRKLEPTGWVIPPGLYGIVRAAGVGIIRRAHVKQAEGLLALERLSQPEAESRSAEFEGRRLVRVNGGFIALNFWKYRSKDATAADRSRRWRERRDAVALRRSATELQRDDTP